MLVKLAEEASAALAVMGDASPHLPTHTGLSPPGPGPNDLGMPALRKRVSVHNKTQSF